MSDEENKPIASKDFCAFTKELRVALIARMIEIEKREPTVAGRRAAYLELARSREAQDLAGLDAIIWGCSELEGEI